MISRTKYKRQLILVIRSNGERTFRVCRELALRQVSECSLFVVNQQPFEAALRETYEIGMTSEAKWMVTLDADVLLRDSAVERLLFEAEAMPENFFQLEGRVLDKLFGSFREAGHRIYRTSYLGIAWDSIPDQGVEIRPECATLQRMSEKGYPSRKISRVFGIHDYEQFYCDIYRKAFIHAHKHQAWLSPLIRRWKSNADADFQIALRGLCDGLMYASRVKIDPSKYGEMARIAMENLGISEKSQLGDLSHGFVERTIAVSGLPVDQNKYEVFIEKISRMGAVYKRIGFLRFLPYLIGSLFCSFGKKLIRLSGRR